MFEPAPHRQKSRPRRLAVGSVSIPGTRAGAVVSVGLVIVAWIAVPLARAFILGTVGVGALIGWFLWWLHSRE